MPHRTILGVQKALRERAAGAGPEDGVSKSRARQESGRATGLRWVQAHDSLERIKRKVSSAETELRNATNQFGQHLNPGDMKAGEIINMWFEVENGREGIVSAKLLDTSGNGTWDVKFRSDKRPFREVPQRVACDPDITTATA